MQTRYWMKRIKKRKNMLSDYESEIRTIAKRLKRMTKVGDQALIHGIFWDDLNILLNLILEADSE